MTNEYWRDVVASVARTLLAFTALLGGLLTAELLGVL